MATQANKSTDFPIEVGDKGLGYNKPQKMGRKLWGPMWSCRSWRSPSPSFSASSAPRHIGRGV